MGVVERCDRPERQHAEHHLRPAAVAARRVGIQPAERHDEVGCGYLRVHEHRRAVAGPAQLDGRPATVVDGHAAARGSLGAELAQRRVGGRRAVSAWSQEDSHPLGGYTGGLKLIEQWRHHHGGRSRPVEVVHDNERALGTSCQFSDRRLPVGVLEPLSDLVVGQRRPGRRTVHLRLPGGGQLELQREIAVPGCSVQLQRRHAPDSCVGSWFSEPDRNGVVEMRTRW